MPQSTTKNINTMNTKKMSKDINKDIQKEDKEEDKHTSSDNNDSTDSDTSSESDSSTDKDTNSSIKEDIKLDNNNSTNGEIKKKLNFKLGDNTIYFNSKGIKYSFLSNFYPSKLMIDNKEYWHVEGYYQSQKFAGINSRAEEHIRTAISTFTCKKLAYSYPFPENRKKEWDNGLRDKIMKRAVLCKFLTNNNLYNRLISTEKATLIEDNRSDEYWAYGKDGNGENKLGIILMDVRAFLNKLN